MAKHTDRSPVAVSVHGVDNSLSLDSADPDSGGELLLNRRQIVLASLLALPLLLYAGFGLYALYETGWLKWIGWSLPVLWIVTWIIAWIWSEPKPTSCAQVQPLDMPDYWTERDRGAVSIIEGYRQKGSGLKLEELLDPHLYLDTSLAIARDLSRHFHQRESDPFDQVTVLEALAAMRMAIEDTENWVRETVPGNQMVTIGQWRMLSGASPWIERATNAYWLGSVLLNPASVVNYLASRYAITPVLTDLQREVVVTLYLKFVNRIGFYLIEMHSGRLKGGANAYRETFGRFAAGHPVNAGPHANPNPNSFQPSSVAIAVMGQVKAGKSSLINALLKSKQAKTDVLPQTRQVARFTTHLSDGSEEVVLLDTPGYAEAGASSAQLAEIRSAVEAADIVLLVLSATSPAKSADAELLQQLKQHYQQHPELKRPPIVAVLTHIDLLSPVREWSPPCPWREPTTPKGTSIRGAVDYTRELFGSSVADIVPICTSDDPARQYGVGEELLPALTDQLDEGRAAALLKSYHAWLNEDKLQRLLKQVAASGKSLLKWWIEERLLPEARK